MSPFEDDRVLAILRYREPCDLGAVVDALRAGGVLSIEVTADTPGALDQVDRARDEGAPDRGRDDPFRRGGSGVRTPAPASS